MFKCSLCAYWHAIEVRNEVPDSFSGYLSCSAFFRGSHPDREKSSFSSTRIQLLRTGDICEWCERHLAPSMCSRVQARLGLIHKVGNTTRYLKPDSFSACRVFSFY
jgi:hypothetical protein